MSLYPVPNIWLPTRGPIIPYRDIEPRKITVPPKIKIVQQAAVSVVQAPAYGTGADPTNVTFASAPTAGNVIFALRAGQNSGSGSPQTSGPTVTDIVGQVSARPTQTYGRIGYRVVQSGDGSTLGFDSNSNLSVRLIEVSGLDPAGSPANTVSGSATASSSVSVALSGTAAQFGFLFIVTRLETPSNSAITLNGSTTAISNNADFAHPANSIGGNILLYGAGNATLGGTQTGTTRDGYNYGHIGFTWGPPPSGTSWGAIIG